MAKTVSKQKSSPAQSKSSGGFDPFGYLMRSFAVAAVIAIVLFMFDKMNEKESQLQDLYREFQQLQQSRSNPQRLQELYNTIIDIQSDTSFLKDVTRGYYWAVHDVAGKGKQNVEEIKAGSAKPLTREDKLAMRVSTWPFIDYIIKNTPEDAIIYLPEGDSITSNNSKWNYLYDPEWMEYFLYPRLCVAMGREEDHPDLAKRVTHVVILEGKGYDKLHYDVPMEIRPKEDVLPIDAPKPKTQPTP